MSNADGTDNEGGLITEYAEVQLVFDDHQETINLAVTTLSSSNVFLGHDWLTKHNPEIDWKAGATSGKHPKNQNFVRGLVVISS